MHRIKKAQSILIGACITLLLPVVVYAATNPTPTPNISTTEQQINNLKDRIASQVATLNLVEKKGIISTVTDVSETQISTTDSDGNIQLIDVDELTKFSSPSAKPGFGISDITKGTTIGAIGLYNKDSKRILARWVDVLQLPRIISGGILAIDKTNYNITVATTNGNTIVEIENITKTNSYTKADGLIRSGFSKLQTGQRVLVVGFPDASNPAQIMASRLTVFPELPVNPKIPMINPTDIAPVSTGSGKKLTPITK